MEETIKAAEQIAGFGALAVMAAKETVNRAYETTMSEAVRFDRRLRSEEHTSELQSLMRISYAVFSLSKKRPGTPSAESRARETSTQPSNRTTPSTTSHP